MKKTKSTRKRKREQIQPVQQRHYYVTVVSNMRTDGLQHLLGTTTTQVMSAPLHVYSIPFHGAIEELKENPPLTICIAAAPYEEPRVCELLTALANTPELALIPYVVIFTDPQGKVMDHSFNSIGARATQS